MDPMNVVIIMTDQQSARSLPMYGNPVVQTPNLASFASRGALFENAFTSCPLCVPARVSMFTGQYPSAHGSLDNNILMSPGRDHLLKALKDAGYATGLAGKNHCFRRDDLKLFDSMAECGHYGPSTGDPKYAEPKRYLQQCGALKACWGSTVNPFPPDRLGTTWTTDRAIEFVEAKQDMPFFLWYSIADPHIPFQTCEPYASMYPPDRVDLSPLKEGEMDSKPRAQQIDRHVMQGDLVDEDTVRRIRSIYYGINTYIDTEIGRFLERLDELGLSDDTLVIYVADHGEYLGEHRMIRKSKAAYDCLTQIPFMVRGPGVRPSACREFVSLEDVMPTVLGMLGIDIPCGVQGRDLTPLLRGESFAGRGFAYGEYGAHPLPFAGDAYAVCESPHSPDFKPSNKVGGYGKMRYLRTDEWKLVAYVQDTYELYNVREDPFELENVWGRPEYAQIEAQLKGQMLEHMMAASNPDAVSGSVS